MPAFLTPEWLAALAAAAEHATVPDELSLTLEQTVEDEAGTVTRTVVAADGRLTVTPGADPAAAIRLRTDRATAASIAAGRASAPRAFLDGRMRLGGDIAALLDARTALEALGDVFAAVRDDTSGLD